MLLSTIGIFIGILFCAISLNTPRKHVLRSAFVGGVSGFVYLICMKIGWGLVISSFFSALTAALLSHIFARLFKAPVLLYLIAGIFPTVPGGGMYRIVAGILDNDSAKVFDSVIEVLEVAGVIALAIFLMDAVFRVTSPVKKEA